eukprot:scaffold320114_cov35-Tisochrysis_lutea.AAC.3
MTRQRRRPTCAYFKFCLKPHRCDNTAYNVRHVREIPLQFGAIWVPVLNNGDAAKNVLNAFGEGHSAIGWHEKVEGFTGGGGVRQSSDSTLHMEARNEW